MPSLGTRPYDADCTSQCILHDQSAAYKVATGPCAGASAVSDAEAAANEKRREEAGGVGSSDEW